jgi:very-short-patch-repair endonuclease
MAYSKVNLTGQNNKEKIESLFEQCSNNNQVCYHLKKHNDLVLYLQKETGLDKDLIILLYHYKENIKDIPKCLCGEPRKYHCWGYRPTCTNKNCIKIEREESKKKFCLENYGVEYVTQLSSMKEKSKETLLKKYGVDNITKLPEVIKKRKEKNLIKWGVEDPISLKEIRGSDSIRGLERIQSGLSNDYKILESDGFYYYIISCPNGHIFEISKSVLYIRKRDSIEICNQCNKSIGSNGEQEVYDYISSFYKNKISRSNRRLISPYEIDIVLDDLKICIEFNGDYWHSTKVNNDEFYHLNKTLLCRKKGYDLLQIKEWEWNNNREEIKRKLFNKINNIYDSRDLILEDDYLIFDLSWYDSRVLDGLRGLPYENIEPKEINIGQYKQWNCGFRVFKIN